MSTVHRMIGTVRLEHPFTLAALAGYSDVGMRVVCRWLGASLTRHEVVLDKLVLEARKGARTGRHLHPDDHPVAAQLLGNDPEVMAQAAVTMVARGHDLIDLNFGCPVKKVLGRCRGGGLLGQPDQAIELVAAVRRAVAVPVMIKLRRGLDDSAKSAQQFWAILERAVNQGIAAITVHGRTVRQRYEGNAQWGILAEVKRRYPGLVVFGSGDLFAVEDCFRMLAETGIDGVTLARGAIHNPWIFRECVARWQGRPPPPPPSMQEQGDLLDWQYRLCIEQYGPERASRQMRKFGIKRAHLHPDSSAVHAAFINLSTPQEWHEVRERFYPATATGVATHLPPGSPGRDVEAT